MTDKQMTEMTASASEGEGPPVEPPSRFKRRLGVIAAAFLLAFIVMNWRIVVACILSPVTPVWRALTNRGSG